MRPCHAILVVEKLSEFPRAPLRRKGVELSSTDDLTTVEVYQQWLLLLLDLGYLHPDTLQRVGTRLFTDMVKVDVLDVNGAFADCLQLIRLQSNKGLKVLCSRISSHLYPLLRDDVLRIPDGDVRAAKRLMQVFAFTSRLSLIDIDLTQQMLEDYVEIEKSFDSYDLSKRDPLVRRLNNVIRRWMADFCHF